MVAVKMFKYRLYPSAKQELRLVNQFKICKETYNTLLDLNKKLRVTRKFDLNGLVMDLKCANPLLAKKVHSQVLQNVSDRLSKAFDNFFERLKLREQGVKVKAGFPRFKSKVTSLTFPQNNGAFKFISDKKLKISKVGVLPIVLHRVPRGKIKTLTVKREKSGKWFAVFSCEVELETNSFKNRGVVGLDLGLETFAYLSDGEFVSNPRFFRKGEVKIRRAQRRLSRKKKGSRNRSKQRVRLARTHERIGNQRSDFVHKTSNDLVSRYETIFVEDLKVKNMIKNKRLSKSIGDVSWRGFVDSLSYKAVMSGGQVIKVSPKNTSKTCSKCGFVKEELSLQDRQFVCGGCGFVVHRDLNAAINVFRVGMGGAEFTPVGHSVRPLFSGAVVDEAGTIYNET